MKLEIKILRYVLVPVIGAFFLYSLIRSYHDYFIFDFYKFWFIGSLGVISFGWTIYQDWKQYQKTHKIKYFSPTLIGLLVFLFIGGYYLKKQNEINSPSLITAFYNGGTNGVSIDLKKNGDYIIDSGSGLGKNSYYGSYTLQDSIVKLDKTKFDNFTISEKLVIRPIKQDYRDAPNEFEYFILQVDKSGKDLDTYLKFRITEDNR